MGNRSMKSQLSVLGTKKNNSLQSSLESGLSVSDRQVCNCDCIYCQRPCDCSYSDMHSMENLSKSDESVADQDDEQLYSSCDQVRACSSKASVPTDSQTARRREAGSGHRASKTEPTNDCASSIYARVQPAVQFEEAEISSGHGLLSTTSNEESLAPSVLAFDEIVTGTFAAYLKASNTIGGDVAKHAEMVKEGITVQRKFLVVASRSKKPGDADLMKLLQPTSEIIQSIQSYREKSRTSPFFNHLSAISESIPALGWVTVAPAPSPYVKEMNDAGQFYTNRVLKDWKEKDKNHVDWVRSWVQVLTELQAFVKQHHTTGLVWNSKGGDAMQNASKAGSAPSAARGGAPPPPGPPPPPMPNRDLFAEEAGGVDESKALLFASLNKGEDVTKGLKKVTSDMQTHKNPALRTTGPVAAPAKPGVGPKPSAPAAAAPVKPPRLELDGKKWAVEYQKNQPGLIISETGMNQTVYVFKCEGSTLQVKGKVNSIVLDSCKKTSVVLDSVVSSVEFVNCQSVQMQVLTKVPTVSIDKTDGCQIYLNKDSLDVSIVSAKSTEMNVLVPKGDGDYPLSV
nr:EOG090X08PR [Sida crystallina]